MIGVGALGEVVRGLRQDPSESRVPGVWLRATGVAAAVATGLVVVSGSLDLGLTHRVLVLVALAPLIALFLAARLAHRDLAPWAGLAVGLVVVEAVVGGVLAAFPGARWATALHVSVGALAFGATAAAAGMTFRGRAEEPAGEWRDYVTLTKPRIMVLLLITAAGGMFAAAHGFPSVRVLALTIVGGGLASGGASALNHVMDRDVDQKMRRTSTRPVAASRVTASRALEFGLALSALSFVLLASLVNVLAAVLALAGNVFYVLVYTGWLKRSTPQNIVIGGAAGAVPPLVGWAAATGHLSLPALSLFLIVFLWTPPHFWALALLMKKDYAVAGIPMLPVVRGERETTRQILLYSVVLVGVTLLPAFFGGLGVVYLVAAAALGAVFLALAWRLRQEASHRRARTLFHYSLLYLAALFVAMAVAPLV